jgi:deazaflavin-dependent oxidoreductase (nitroreductase family)
MTTDSRSAAALLSRLKSEEYCYLTTTGRISGRPHQIEIWFAIEDSTLYLLSGNHKSDWVRNLRAQPAVNVRIAQHRFAGLARLVEAEREELVARHRVAEKYQEWEEDKTLSEWARTALPVAIDIQAGEQAS